MRKGLTLIELIVALAVFMVLSMSVMVVWHQSSQSVFYIFNRQNAFEQARGALDSMIMNVQMAHTVALTTDQHGNLELLVLTQLRDEATPTQPRVFWNYVYYFDVNALPDQVGSYQRLRFSGPTNELARGIKSVVIELDREISPRRMYITITTACPPPREAVVVMGSVCLMYKNFTQVRPLAAQVPA